MEKKVGVKIQVGTTGTENIDRLQATLKAAGVSTEDLDGKAAELGSQLRKLTQQQELIEAFKRQKASVEQASAALQEAKDKAGAMARELKATEEPTKKQEAAFDKARKAARDAADAFEAQRLKLQQLRTSMADAGVGTDTLAKSQLRIKQESAEVRDGLQRLEAAYKQAAQGAVQSAGVQAKASTQVKDGLADLGRQLSTVRNLAQAAIGGQLLGGLVGEVSQTADAYTNLAARIRLAAGDGAAFETAFKGVFEVATRTNSAVESTGQLFTKLAQAGKALGVSQAEALALTETINQAIQLSGVSAASSDAAITQLVQGLQGGVLRGDEFNSVMEQAPRLAQALADGLGVTTGELRKMAEAGQLSSEVVVQALRGQGKTLNDEFSKLPQTVGRALQNLSTEWTRYVGEVDKATGISSTAAGAINALARNLDTLAGLLTVAGKAGAAYAALELGKVFRGKAAAALESAASLTRETQAVTANTAATAANTAAKAANAAATGAAAAAAGTAAAASTAAAAAATAAAGAVSQSGAAAAGAAVGGWAALRARALGFLGVLGPIGAGIAAISLAWDGIKGAGTWLGETAAKLAGARDRTAELEEASKAAAKAAQEEATARAAQAQQTALAADKALGLTNASRALLASFDDMRSKGTSTSEALGKLAKDLDLGAPRGIYDAVAALDALERKGKATGFEVREALRQALDGKDLGIFEVQARSAFDGSEQGARRLAAALEAMRTEALARVGTSVSELQTGFTAAFNRAANDTDALAQSLKALGTEADRAGPLLARSIDKETEAATTARALKLVQERLQQLARDGSIGADLLAEGLEKVRKKAAAIEDATPGVQSLADAARKAGVEVAALTGAVSTGFASSLQPVTELINQIVKAGIAAEKASPVLAAALSKRVETAQTRAELEALIVEIERARRAGVLLGIDFSDAMRRAQNAIEALTPTLRQAQKDAASLGVTLKDKIAGGADAGVNEGLRAYERLKAGSYATEREVSAAFVNLATKAIEANKGIVPEWVKVEAAARLATIQVDEFGKATVKAADLTLRNTGFGAAGFGDVAAAADAAAKAVDRYNAAQQAGSRGAAGKAADGGALRSGSVLGPSGSSAVPTGADGRFQSGSGAAPVVMNTRQRRTAPLGPGGAPGDALGDSSLTAGAGQPLSGSGPSVDPQGATQTGAAAGSTSTRRYEVNLRLNGSAGAVVGLASAADAERLASWLRTLELESRRAA